MEVPMIDGLRVEVPTKEIAQLLDERIKEHRENAEEDEASAKKFTDTEREDDDDAIYDVNPVKRLHRRAAQERDREASLTFLRDHLVKGEVYSLTADDLRTLEILQGRMY
jgi:hypothetical protein